MRLDRPAAVTDNVAVFVTPPWVAVIVAVTGADTDAVVIVKTADVDPGETVTAVGAFALVLLEERLTVAPPEGAGPLSVTVPVESAPPTTELGDTLRPESTAGVIVRIAV